MSCIRCDGCSRIIDSDFDPDCFVEVGNMRAQTKDVVWCESCRDEKLEAFERANREFSPEQQAYIDMREAEADPDGDQTP
jgi:hypothetical protein